MYICLMPNKLMLYYVCYVSIFLPRVVILLHFIILHFSFMLNFSFHLLTLNNGAFISYCIHMYPYIDISCNFFFIYFFFFFFYNFDFM